MVFTSLEFLFLFFPIVLIGYYFITPKAGFENVWLFLASLFFYYIGAKEQIWLLVFIILIAYVSGVLETYVSSMVHKSFVLILTIAAMLSAMVYFKYFNFMIHNINPELFTEQYLNW